jgi:hypothetical protein
VNLVTRLALLAAAVSILWLAGRAPLVPAVTAIVLSGASVSLAHGGRLRPWSDLLAWAGIMPLAWSTMVERPTPVTAGLLVVASIYCVAALHVPAAGVPNVRPVRATASAMAVATILALVVWWPAMRIQDQVLAVQDPASAASMALRTLLATAGLGLAAWLLVRMNIKQAKAVDEVLETSFERL